MANILKNTIANIVGTDKKNEVAAAVPATVVHHRTPLTLIETFDPRSQKAALRSLANAVQFALYSTADWIVRQELRAQASEEPTLDERNEADEFSRGEDPAMVGMEQRENPLDKMKTYSHLYYGLVEQIRSLKPEPFERPKGLIVGLEDYGLQNTGTNPDTLALLEAAGVDGDELNRARDELKTRRMEQLNERKPRIKQLLEEHSDIMPMLEVFTELPVHVQLRLACGMWKGIHFSRKSLVAFIASTNRTDDIGAVKAMKADMELLENWCAQYESQHSDVIEALLDVGTKVYGIDDAKDDIKRKR
jgi:hypothetical protein